MNNRTRLGRLRKLADLLEALPNNEQFEMGIWARHEGEGAPHLDADKLGCGTAACALGSAAMLPAFQRAGLTLEAVPSSWSPYAPRYLNARGCAAGEAFFGITEAEAEALFDNGLDSYPRPSMYSRITPSRVAKKVRKLIRQYEQQAA